PIRESFISALPAPSVSPRETKSANADGHRICLPIAAENGQTSDGARTMFIPNATEEDDMASIRKNIVIEAPAAKVWDALRDFHAVDTRLATGFVMKSVPDGDTRVLTFSNGSVLREDLVSIDDSAQRLVYAICTSDRLRHYRSE